MNERNLLFLLHDNKNYFEIVILSKYIFHKIHSGCSQLIL